MAYQNHNQRQIQSHIFFTIFSRMQEHNMNSFAAFLIKTNGDLIHKVTSKFQLLKNVLSSTIYGEYNKNEFFDAFSNMQRIYWSLNRFAFIYKVKRAKIQIETDLLLQEIPKKSLTTCICIYHERKNYWFLYRDLIKIIVTSLSNSSNFFAYPLPVKNPYNNTIFPKSILYTIYFGLLKTNYMMPLLLQKYFQCNFDMSHFLIQNEHLLVEQNIKNYVNNLLVDDAVHQIEDMLKWYNDLMPGRYHISVHEDFPKSSLDRVFRPFLVDFYNCDYSLIATVKSNALQNLKSNLIRFKKHNRGFGRKVYKFVNKKAVIGFADQATFAYSNNDLFLFSHKSSSFVSLRETYSDDEDDETFRYIGRNNSPPHTEGAEGAEEGAEEEGTEGAEEGSEGAEIQPYDDDDSGDSDFLSLLAEAARAIDDEQYSDDDSIS